MKYIFTIILFSILAINLKSQNNSPKPFADKVFKIDNYINNKFDNTEDLTFDNIYVEGSICTKYGFKKAKYTVVKNKAGLPEFSCTMISDEHGKMVWKGIKNKKSISGSYLWTKAGQDPIHYTFTGKLK